MSESSPGLVDEARPLGALDSFFLYTETPSSMMHVAALLRFTLPPGAPADYPAQLVDEIRREAVVQDPWNRKLKHPKVTPPPLQSWVVDQNFDIDYHFRHSALPSPGGERELGYLVSRLHSTPLDLDRPPWELHVIEGFADGGFAIYVKLHHALADGGTVLRMLMRCLLVDPEVTDTPIMFAVPPLRAEPGPDAAAPVRRGVLDRIVETISLPMKAVSATVAAAGELGNVAGQLAAAVGRYVKPDDGTDRPKLALQAPDSILNRRIGRNRRFATQELDLTEIKRIAKARGATVNDVCLAVLGGSLRRYLDELRELPERSLVSFVPIDIRPKGDDGGGNAVGAMLVEIGSDVADPLQRLAAVCASSRAGKAPFAELSLPAALVYSMSFLGPATAQAVISTAGLPDPIPTTFNVSVSNVPGPREDRYFRGCRLEAVYPVSIPYHSALNVTFIGYRDKLDFGFIGDRDVVPHLQRLAVYTGEALTELGSAVDAAGAAN